MVHSLRKKPRKTGRKRYTVICKFESFIKEEGFEDNYGLIDLFNRAFESFDRIAGTSDEVCTPDERTKKISSHLLHFIQNKFALAPSLKSVSHEEKNKVKHDMHSIFLYSVLKNIGFECKEADEYYEVLEGGFPQLDWSLYFQLIKDCQWSSFFIKSMLQVPDSVAICALREMLVELKSSDNIILCHSAIQILVIKSLNSEYECSHLPFGLPFVNIKAESTANESNDDKDLFCDIFKIFINFLKFYEHSEKFTSVLLSGLITTFELLCNCNNDEEILDVVTLLADLNNYLLFMKDYFQSKDVSQFLRSEFENFNYFQFVPSFTMNEKFEWHCSYLVFLAYIKWMKVTETFDKKKLNKVYDIIDSIVQDLFSNHPLNDATNSIVDKYVPMLISQIKMNLDGFHFAIDFFLKNGTLLKRPEVLSCLKDIEMYGEKKRDGYFQLMKAAFTATSPEKTELFQMFLNWYEYADLPLKKELMRVRVSYRESGIKSASFDQDLLNISNFTSDSHDAVTSKLLCLCMQSIEETIERIIGDVVNYGKTKLILVKGLKDIPYVCSYRKPTSEHQLPILIEVLKPHFKTSNKGQILFLLTETLLKTFTGSDSDAFHRHHFVNYCIMDTFSSGFEETNARFYCELLHIVLLDTLNNDDLLWLNCISVSTLLETLASSLHWAICHYNISLKDEILDILSILLRLKRKTNAFEKFVSIESQQRFMSFLQSKHPNVKFYILDFLVDSNIDIMSLSLKSLVCYCIIRDKTSAFVDFISQKNFLRYEHIITAVAEILPWLSMDEVIALSNLLKEVHMMPNDDNNEENEAVNNFPEDENKLFISIKILSDALYSLNSSASLKDVSVLHNFSNAVNSHWNDISSDITTFKQVFLEIVKLSCHMSHHGDIFNAILLSFAEEIDWTKIDALIQIELKKELIVEIEKLIDKECCEKLLKFFIIPQDDKSAEQVEV